MAKAPKTKSGTFDSIDELNDAINNKFGAGSVITSNSIINVKTFSTGVMSIDEALGVGGLPEGRMIELFGKESSGKTTSCLQFIAACQKHYFPHKERYGNVAFIDAEHALDPDWATKNGCDIDKINISQPGCGEEALEIAAMYARSRLIDLVVIDSVAALVPKSELDGELTDNSIGAQARLMSKGCRSLSSIASKSGTTIIFINQVREKIGVMFGNPETTPGGRALKFYSSIRMELSKGSKIQEGNVVVGFRPSMKIIKNKVAPPFRVAQFDICNGSPERPVFGIDKVASLIDVGAGHKIITLKGSHYSYGDAKLGNGLANAAEYLRGDVELYFKIYEDVSSKLFSRPVVDDFSVDDMIDDSE